MEWTEEQKQAINKSGSNILVAAAAGSGKTAVLVERIINKVIKERIDIDSVLVVTFTNAAAAEMRERILRTIYKITDDENVDEDLFVFLQRQITLLNKANICTIDSFCLDVIRNNFFEIDITPNFRIADTAEMDLVKQEVLENLFEEKYDAHNSDFEELIKTYTSYRDDNPLKDLIIKIYTYIQSTPFPLQWLNLQIEKFNIKNIKQDFIENEWGSILVKELKSEIEINLKLLQLEAKRLSFEKDLEQYLRVINSDISQLETLILNLDSWDKIFLLANKLEFLKWPVSRKITHFEKDRAKQVRDKVKKNIRAIIEKILVSNSVEANKDLIEMYNKLYKLQNLIIEFDERFNKLKREKNIVDFSDIEHLALKILLKNDGNKVCPSEIAKKYQQKFNEIAIDEYQDSNLVQEYILTSISKGNNIFMVGDVKQSIYKFRQAMPDLFLKKYTEYSEHNSNDKGLKIKLFKNFRSRKNVLDFTNLIFENIMGENFGEINYNKEEYLNLGANYTESKENLITQIDILDTGVEEEENQTEEKFEDDVEKTEDIEIEAKYVANKINQLINNKFQVFDNKLNQYRNIQNRDIVILLRSTKNKANIYEKELIKQNIDVYSDTSSSYLDSYEIQIIMDLLKIIDNPYQDLPLVHIMLSCIGMFTNDDLVRIRLCEKNDDFYTAMLKSKNLVDDTIREKIDVFIKKIDLFRNLSRFLSIDELIWNIYEETGFLNYVALMPNGSLRVANLKLLFEKAKQYSDASFSGLFNFINFINRVKIGSGDMGSAKIISESENVVRIMSIHKSKGLEFPVVFISGMGTLFNLMDLNQDILIHQELGIGAKFIDYDKQIKYDTLAKMAIKTKTLEENLSEEMRVLYVALTRAKEKIYITAIKKNYSKDKEKLEELVELYNKENGKINPNILKKSKKFIDWILLVYLYNKDYAKNIIKLNILSRKEILQGVKTSEKKEEADIIGLLEKGSKTVKEEDIIELKNNIEYEYKYKDLSKIPSKESVTNIVHKDYENKSQNEDLLYDNYENISIENDEFIKYQELAKPKFLENTDNEIITKANVGTLIHLCMKNLDFKKEYSLEDVNNLIQSIEEKGLITKKEKEKINPYIILKFTKTQIFQELKEAKEYHKEEPFYINIPANNVMDTDLKEKILVQGIIDLYYIDKNDRLVLLDYKTDFAKEGDEEKLISKHKPQLEIYKKALENALNKKVDEVYIYSTAINKPIKI